MDKAQEVKKLLKEMLWDSSKKDQCGDGLYEAKAGWRKTE